MVVWSLWKNLKSPELTWKHEFGTEWNVAYGNSNEEIYTDPFHLIVSTGKTDLPHRELRPNSTIWYFREINFSEKGVLAIDADDGAQLLLNDKQVKRIHGIYFPIDSAGPTKVTIRVLNNAMEGGLRRVAFSSVRQFEKYKSQYQLYASLKLLVEKILLMREPDTTMISLVVRALKIKDRSSVIRAMEQLEDHPVLFPYLIRRNTDSMQIQVLCDVAESIHLTVMEDRKSKQSYRATGPLALFRIPMTESNSFRYQLSCLNTVSDVYGVEGYSADSAWAFNVWADSQGGWSTFQKHMQNEVLQKNAFGIGAGDLVANGSDSLQWVDLIKALSVSASLKPYYLVPGNHDYDGYYDDLVPAFYKKFIPQASTGYFSWRFGDAAFIALDANENFPIGIKRGCHQYKWFQREINSHQWKKATWRFVVLHQPPYSQGWEGYQGDKVIRDLLEPVIESAKIDFVISGHTHDYERLTKQYGTQQTTFVVVGGGGGTVEPEGSQSSEPRMDTIIKKHHIGQITIDSKHASLKVFDSNCTTIDSFQITK